MGVVTYRPTVRFRVLAVDWEGEHSTECWTQDVESAKEVARALRVRDVHVQIDTVALLECMEQPA